MNYLAHAFLSFNHQPILTGNMISDFVKGKQNSISLQKFRKEYNYTEVLILLQIIILQPKKLKKFLNQVLVFMQVHLQM